MEESQARNPGNRRLAGGPERAATPEHGLALDLHRVGYGELAASQSRFATTLLGTVAYGSRRPPLARIPAAWVPLPVLNGDDFCELWLSHEPVVRSEALGISGAHNEHIVFGCLQMTEQGTLESAAESTYSRLFDYVDELGFPHLLRAWNYFPGINSHTDDMERYRRFNIGRHQAFMSKGRAIGEHAPAACALGCESGPLTVLFIAGRTAGQPIENPRQMSAYRYPERYGRRSPTFSRAMLLDSPKQRVLFISGTASIVGHETLHAGDVDAQIQETITNLRAVFEAADCSDPQTGGGRKLSLKAYIRRPEHAPRVQTALQDAFEGAEVVYLQADICRSDLLVEVEAAYFQRMTP